MTFPGVNIDTLPEASCDCVIVRKVVIFLLFSAEYEHMLVQSADMAVRV